jgi:hypothetical protein
VLRLVAAQTAKNPAGRRSFHWQLCTGVEEPRPRILYAGVECSAAPGRMSRPEHPCQFATTRLIVKIGSSSAKATPPMMSP